MKGIILAGGTGSRLSPLTDVTNKHLLPVGRKPMLYYPIEKLVQAGIEEILIVTGTEHMGSIVGLLGSGSKFGCHFTYKVQDEAGGIAQALLLGENFVHGDKMAVILGDNVFEDGLIGFVNDFEEQHCGAKLVLTKAEDPSRFGVAEIYGDRIISIEEKPLNPKSDMIVTGIYFYDHHVFDYIRRLEPSRRGEYEITDVNNLYLKESELTYSVLDGWWTDAGTFESLQIANSFVSAEREF